MAWVTPTLRATGFLVTASVWNQDVVDNPKAQRGQAGIVEIEDTINPLTDLSKNLGLISDMSRRWKDVNAESVFAGGFKSPSRREVRIPWEVADEDASSRPDVEVTYTEVSGGTIRRGGTGQVVAKVDDDVANSEVRIDGRVEQNSAANNAFTATKRPYFRIEMFLATKVEAVTEFFGFRVTPGSGIPLSTEIHMGFKKLGTGSNTWFAVNSGGAGQTTTNVDAFITTAARHVLECFMHDSRVEFWVDGTLRATHTANLPTGSFELTPLVMKSDGTGVAAADTLITLGQIIAQEDL